MEAIICRDPWKSMDSFGTHYQWLPSLQDEMRLAALCISSFARDMSKLVISDGIPQRLRVPHSNDTMTYR